MKGENMSHRYRFFLLLLAVSFLLVAVAVYPQDKFKLKPGARGKICQNCHVTFEEKMKKPFLHTPVRTGECSGCHSPHASSHAKLLADDVTKVCYRCHQTMIPDNAKSAHKVVVEGGCVKCHDPHSADSKFNLLKTGNELCYGCHKAMGEAIEKARFKHAPVTKGCTGCHNPHGSAKAGYLLSDEVPDLCVKCHKTDTPSFTKQHMNYPVAKAKCTTCHNPHGSDRGGILYNNVHKPVANRMCNQCHNDPTSPTPFATKKPGYELCRGCHTAIMNEIAGKNKLHWPVMSKKGCLSCHNPHASTENKLLKAPLLVVCGQCHGDTVARQERSLTKHPPIKEGNCTICHSPHASDNSFFLVQASVIDLCGTCHDWQKHSTHPIGEKTIDPRNKNLTVQCLTCHRAHGTENKNFVYTAVVADMCTQCHVQYKR
jgi:predicted CXXCH cytochrome family protein